MLNAYFDLMKSIISLILFYLIAGCALKNNTGRSPQKLDHRESYSKLMLDDKIWMVHNLEIIIPGSYCQKDDAYYCSRYGVSIPEKQLKQDVNNLAMDGACLTIRNGNTWRDSMAVFSMIQRTKETRHI